MNVRKTLSALVSAAAVFAAVLVLSVCAMPVRALAAGPYKAKLDDGDWYLMDLSTSKPVTGLKGMEEVPAGSGNYYWFKNTDGEICRRQWIVYGNKKYRALSSGKLASGRTKVGTKYYYFNNKTHVMRKNVWIRTKNGYMRFGSNGKQLMGLTQVKKYTYYFDPEKKGIRATGWKTVSGETYYFNEKGKMQKGFVKINDKTYYFNTKGVMVTGWMTDGNKKYYFNKKTGVMSTGNVTIDGKKYDFGTKGYIIVEVTGTWSIRVNKSTNVVTIYRGSTPIKAMLCSVGLNDATPSGTFSLQAPKTNWHPLFGGVYGQYCRTITGNILFHSVYYNTYRNIHTLATGEYVKLGQAASHGCVRLSAGDAYYIWVNVPTGTKVTIGYFGSTDPLPRPSLTPLNGKDYDPTDPILTD